MEYKKEKIVVFYSFHPSDAIFLQKLTQTFYPLERNGYIEDGSVREPLLGIDSDLEEFARRRKRALDTATHILLLCSPEYLFSQAHYQEMRDALERHASGKACVIPILLRPCLWQEALGQSLPCLPRNGQPVTLWRKADKAFFDIFEGFCEKLGLSRSHYPPSERNNLLQKISDCCIQDLLARMLEGGPSLDVALQEQPDMVLNHLQAQYPELNKTSQRSTLVQSSRQIEKIFENAHGPLLISGEPGAGKTVLLLQLMQKLLEQARVNEHYPLPVFFNLSSWAQDGFSREDQRNQTKTSLLARITRRSSHENAFSAWLVKELGRTYGVRPKLARQLVEKRQLTLLLDGLDEVYPEMRNACVAAIISYLYDTHRPREARLVLCCRRQEFKNVPQHLRQHLRLSRVIALQPLSTEEVNKYLSIAQGELGGLRTLQRNDPEFAELLQQPLMLHVAAHAFQGEKPDYFSSQIRSLSEDLDQKDLAQERLRQTVFAAYVTKMLNRRKEMSPKRQKQFRQWLCFLAQDSQTFSWFSAKDFLLFPLSILESPEYQGLFTVIFFLVSLPIVLLLREPIVTFTTVLAKGPFEALNAILPVVPTSVQSFLFIPLFILAFLAESISRLYNKWLHEERPLVEPANRLAERMEVVREGLFTTFLLGFRYGALLVAFYLISNNASIFTIGGGLFLGAYLGTVGEIASISFSPFEKFLFLAGFLLLCGFFAGLPFIFLVGVLPGLIFLLVYILAGLACGLLAPFMRSFASHMMLWRTNSLPWNITSFFDEAADRLLLRKAERNTYMFVHRLLRDYLAEIVRDHPYRPTPPVTMNKSAEHPTLPPALRELADIPTSPLPPLPSNQARLLPCGHEEYRSGTRHCSVCGTSIPYRIMDNKDRLI